MSHLVRSAHLSNRTRRKKEIHRARVILSKAGQHPAPGIPEAEQRAKDLETFRVILDEQARQGINLLERAKAWLRRTLRR